ncbi:DNA-binding transcription factor cat8 [Pyricularia oryzae]
MPGILPMKVIKVGTSSQSRIAQACDRCRSKKIRCDGIRPTCTQCANVGFECKTSDKLSRRAFPRGYTESLEERVRALEAEVRDLKDLLDEKDEKIDMLSRMHGNSRKQSQGFSATPPRDPARDASGSPKIKEDTFRVSASPLVLGVENSDSYQMGSSSGRAFIETFKRKLLEAGKPCPDFNPEAFLHIQGCYPLLPHLPKEEQLGAPPRLFSDRCVNVFFQEWAPLFPVIHKPTFLRIYEEFVTDPEKVKSHHKLAHLHLVFSIAAISGEKPDLDQIAICEQQWRRSLELVLMDNTMATLQCLILALIFCAIRADYKRLQYYKGIAVGLSHRLGLHQCQKQFSFGALTLETRKKVFWTLYTMDCFTAATLGLPRLMAEIDIHAEYPSDIDDEYVTEKGFQPTLPGEYTKVSSALALFRATRILASVLDKVYPTTAAHELSLQKMAALAAELNEWNDKLPRHLKLTFKQDKPSTDVTGSRSPLLAFVYYYIRTLIFRPALGSSLGPKAASAIIAVGESSKHMIQITQLLEERNMSFSLCLNKADTLILCGMELLYHSLDVKTGSKTMRDTESLVNSVIKTVETAKAPGSYDFKRVAGLLVSVDEATQQRAALPTPPSHSPETTMAAPTQRSSPQMPQPVMPPRNAAFPLGRHTSATMSETDLLPQQEKLRRLSMPQSSTQPELARTDSRSSYDGNRRHDVNKLAKRDHRLSLSMTQAKMITRLSPHPRSGARGLDFLPLGGPKPQQHQGSQPPSPVQSRPRQQVQEQYSLPRKPEHKMPSSDTVSTTAEWEALLGSMDGGQVNVYDAIYGGPGLASFTATETPAPATSGGWSPDSWDLSGITIGGTNGGEFDVSSAPVAQSVLSISDESLSSAGEELDITGLDFGHHHHMASTSMTGTSDGLMMEPLNGRFGL